ATGSERSRFPPATARLFRKDRVLLPPRHVFSRKVVRKSRQDMSWRERLSATPARTCPGAKGCPQLASGHVLARKVVRNSRQDMSWRERLSATPARTCLGARGFPHLPRRRDPILHIEVNKVRKAVNRPKFARKAGTRVGV